MARLRVHYNWSYIRAKNKLGIIRPVEKEKKLMFGVVLHYMFQCLITKPTYTFQLSF